MGYLDLIPGLGLSNVARNAYLRVNKVPHFPNAWRREVENSVGGPNAWIDAYGMLAISKLRFYSESMHEAIGQTNPWTELNFPVDRAKRWDPLHRGVWIAARVLEAGHLLQAKGYRVVMHSSVEVRYPFLDEDVFDFLAKLHPRWRLRGFRDKHLLRLLAERGCQNLWHVGTKLSSAHRWIAFTSNRSRCLSRSFSARNPCAKPAILIQPPLLDGGPTFVKCARLAATAFRRDGSDGGRRDAALASSFHGRRAGGFA